LEVNIADYHVDVEIDAKYSVLQEVMSKYYGLMDSLNTFLEELSHPYKNWQFIVKEARAFSLNYFHLLKSHPKGDKAARIFVDIFCAAVESVDDLETRIDAVDNVLLFIQKIIKEAGSVLERFKPVINDAFSRIHLYDDETFFLFVKSFYQIKRLAEEYLKIEVGADADFTAVNRLLAKYFQHTYVYWLSEEDPQAWFEKEIFEINPSARFSRHLEEQFNEISHEQLHQRSRRIEKIIRDYPMASRDTTQKLVALRGYNEFVEIYQKMPQKLFKAGSILDSPCKKCTESNACMIGESLSPCKECLNCNQGKLLFLFHIMNISGLATIHEETLRNINCTLIWLIAHEDHKNVRKLLSKPFRY
jgi:pyruvate,orthophosphate dikinase